MEKEIDVSNGTPEPKENGKEKETEKEDPQVATDTEKDDNIEKDKEGSSGDVNVSFRFEECLDAVEEEGLTEDQIYISKVLRGIRKACMYGETLDNMRRDSKDLERLTKEEREPAFVAGFIKKDYKDKTVFKFNSPTPVSKMSLLPFKKERTVTMTDYVPKIFHDIRKKCNVTTEEYVRSWTYSKENLPSPNLGAGRSGSLFVSSEDKRFIFKTIPDFEVETLFEILPHLHRHYVEHPESRIIRFLGLHCFYNSITREESYCVVMNNLLFSPIYSIDEKYDLKGRIPKPGKEGRYADKVDKSLKVLKDNDLLDRRFHLRDSVRDHLLNTLHSDVEFLKKHNCMDYSLLVGIHHLSEEEIKSADAREKEKTRARKKGEKEAKKRKKQEEKERKKEEREAKKKAKKDKSSKDKQKEKEGGEDKDGAEKGKGKKAKGLTKKRKVTKKKRRETEIQEINREELNRPEILEGVMEALRSDFDHSKELYFIGIIDPLSRYLMKKKLAHFLKEMIWSDETLSTVPADYYAERYARYCDEIFVSKKSEKEKKKEEEKEKKEKEKEEKLKKKEEEKKEKEREKEERKSKSGSSITVHEENNAGETKQDDEGEEISKHEETEQSGEEEDKQGAAEKDNQADVEPVENGKEEKSDDTNSKKAKTASSEQNEHEAKETNGSKKAEHKDDDCGEDSEAQSNGQVKSEEKKSRGRKKDSCKMKEEDEEDEKSKKKKRERNAIPNSNDRLTVNGKNNNNIGMS